VNVAGACDVISPSGEGKLCSDSDRAGGGGGSREDGAGRLGGTGAGNIL